MQEEIWKDVPGYEGSYQVSNLGRVKSIKFNKEKILKLVVSNRGYLHVNLCNKGKRKTIQIHQLVAMSFLNHKPNGYNGLIVDHIDNNPLNNRLSNLQLINARENTSKDKNGYSKYTGVCWSKEDNKWRSKIAVNGKNKHLGRFKCELAAVVAYQKELIKLNK